MRNQGDVAERDDPESGRSEASEPEYLRCWRERQCARSALDLEARLRNPWRDSNGREGALEAWG
jgi:hypothetical protein